MYPDMTRPSRFHSPLAGSRAVHKEVRKRKPRSCRLYLHVSSNYTTKRHRTDRNRDTQTTERRHEHTEQATGQVRGHTHHSPLRLPTLAHPCQISTLALLLRASLHSPNYTTTPSATPTRANSTQPAPRSRAAALSPFTWHGPPLCCSPFPSPQLSQQSELDTKSAISTNLSGTKSWMSYGL